MIFVAVFCAGNAGKSVCSFGGSSCVESRCCTWPPGASTWADRKFPKTKKIKRSDEMVVLV